MRKFFTTLVVIALFVVLVVFAVANRHDVTVSFDPFSSGDPMLSSGPIPLFAVIVASVAVGVVVGGCATWLGQRRWRRAARQHRADAETAKAELANLKANAAQGGPQRLPASFQPGPPAGLFGPYGRDKQGASL